MIIVFLRGFRALSEIRGICGYFAFLLLTLSVFSVLFHEKASQSYFIPVTNIFFKVLSVLLPFALYVWAWLWPGAC